MFQDSAPAPAEVDVFDLIPAEHHEEARRFFRELSVSAAINGITPAEALAAALRPHVTQMRRRMGVEAFEEQGLSVTDTRGNTASFALLDPGTIHLKAA